MLRAAPTPCASISSAVDRIVARSEGNLLGRTQAANAKECAVNSHSQIPYEPSVTDWCGMEMEIAAPIAFVVEAWPSWPRRTSAMVASGELALARSVTVSPGAYDNRSVYPTTAATVWSTYLADIALLPGVVVILPFAGRFRWVLRSCPRRRFCCRGRTRGPPRCRALRSRFAPRSSDGIRL